MDVLIVGAGIMGCASALTLNARGANVTLLERALPGAEASSAAGGILGAQIESHDPNDLELLSLFVKARSLFPEWAAELRERSGIDVGHRVSGVMKLASNESERSAHATIAEVHTGRGLRAEILSKERALALEPTLGEGFEEALYFPEDAQVDPPQLLRALAATIATTNVHLKSGAMVQAIVVEKGRCVGVRTEAGEIRADRVVIAAGSWSSLVAGMPSALPKVVPARGQMVMLEQRPPKTRAIVFGNGVYVVPRGDGRVVLGSTLEFVGFQREVTAEGVQSILSGALRSVPSLKGAELARTWCNFRPFTGERPLVGRTEIPGLLVATGHHRNGILLAKWTADRIAEEAFA